MDQIYDKMERGEAWIAPYYAGDYLMMVGENEDLRFCFPEEGLQLLHRRAVHPHMRDEQGRCGGVHQLPLLAGSERRKS